MKNVESTSNTSLINSNENNISSASQNIDSLSEVTHILIAIGFIFIAYLITHYYTKELDPKNMLSNPFRVLLTGCLFLVMLLIYFVFIKLIYQIGIEIDLIAFSAIAVTFSVLITITYNLYTKKEDKKNEKYEKEVEIKNFIISLKDEINIVWNHYNNSLGVFYEDESIKENGFLVFYPITMDYFTIYNNNTDKLGRIKNNELREAIIGIYLESKGLIDSYIFNNKMLEELHKNNITPEGKEELEYMIKGYGKELYRIHFALKEKINHINTLFKQIKQ